MLQAKTHLLDPQSDFDFESPAKCSHCPILNTVDEEIWPLSDTVPSRLPDPTDRSRRSADRHHLRICIQSIGSSDNKLIYSFKVIAPNILNTINDEFFVEFRQNRLYRRSPVP